MEHIITEHVLKVLLGIGIGGVLGYLYYRFIGCSSGACPITSNKYIATLYGAVMGLIITL